jgi:hypothetical protein
VRVTKGGKLLSAEQTMRLAVVSAVDRAKLLKAIVAKIQRKAKHQPRTGTR